MMAAGDVFYGPAGDVFDGCALSVRDSGLSRQTGRNQSHYAYGESPYAYGQGFAYGESPYA